MTSASQITSLTIVYSTVYSGADHRKHQNSASLAFVHGIHQWAVNSLPKGPVARKMFPFDDAIKCFKDYKICIHVWIVNQIDEINSIKIYMMSVLHSNWDACWCSGDFRSQCISRNGIVSQSRNILPSSIRRVNAPASIYFIKLLYIIRKKWQDNFLEKWPRTFQGLSK